MDPFVSALEKGLSEGDLADAMRGITVGSVADARALVAAIPRFPTKDDSLFSSPLGVVVRLYQAVDDDAVADALGDGFPAVHALFDRVLSDFREAADEEARRGSELVSMLRVAAGYASEGGLARVLSTMKEPKLEDEYGWLGIFKTYAVAGHPHQEAVFAASAESLPNGFCAVALLDASNELARERRLAAHPFATPAGIAKLRAWLEDEDPERFSFAHSATAALPFVPAPDRAALLALAFDHADAGVRRQAAWADAATGGTRGIVALVEACSDPHAAVSAMAYLRELGREASIPEVDPDFEAMAELSAWLQHPNELGRVPDELALYDTRELHWPPTNDRRRVWLFSYRVGEDRGLGMVGSTTFALFGETTADLPAEDAYALHCCWELAMKEDPRAPDERSIAAGRKLLGFPARAQA